MIVSERTLRSFILAYLDKLHELTQQVKQVYPTIALDLLFPEFIVKPFQIKGVISRRHGVAIGFIKPTNEIIVEIVKTDKRIEDTILPRLSDGNKPVFHINESFVTISNLNIISKDFYAKYKDVIEALTRATNLIVGPNLGYVVKVIRGDVKLVDVSIAYREKGQYKVKKIPFLWIFGSNDEKLFNRGTAEDHALLDFQRFLHRLAPRISIGTLSYIVREYDKLVTREYVKEEEIINFLYYNPFILALDCTHIEKKPKLNHEHIPDFIIQTSTGYFIIVELESPRKKLFTSEKGFPEHRDLREARAQIERYLEFAKNNVLYLSRRYPNIKTEKIRGLLVIGLKSRMSKDEIDRLKSLNSRLHDYEIVTYDELSDRIKAFVKLLLLRFGPYTM